MPTLAEALSTFLQCSHLAVWISAGVSVGVFTLWNEFILTEALIKAKVHTIALSPIYRKWATFVLFSLLLIMAYSANIFLKGVPFPVKSFLLGLGKKRLLILLSLVSIGWFLGDKEELKITLIDQAGALISFFTFLVMLYAVGIVTFTWM